MEAKKKKKPAAIRIVYERKDGSWGWKLRGEDGDFFATNGNQHYPTERKAREMADQVLGGAFKDADKKVSRRAE